MSCYEIQSWTFVGLVAAFLDLSIAFLLLCASTLAYSVSKFLGLFGLCLPCPCNGLFGDPNRGKCWQSVLVNCPSEKLSSIRLSVKNKFPFDSIWDNKLYFEPDPNQKVHEREVDDEASCSSFREWKSVGSGVLFASNVKEEKFDVKGKGLWNQKIRHALRRRKKGAGNNGRFFSVSSPDNFQSDAHAPHQSPSSVTKTVDKRNEDGRESSVDMDGRKSPGFDSNETTKDMKSREKDGLYAEVLKISMQEELFEGNDDKDTIRLLKDALEEEQASRSALYLDLESERNAAASAADEAMAMILRLQEEKASIEMEARQYRRMIEEKSAYDLEEMNILKEILLRREREKHFLEKEVETYRQLLLRSEQLDSDAQDRGLSDGRSASLLYSGEDPGFMLQRIGESICETEKVEHANKFLENEIMSTESRDYTLALGKELRIPEMDEVDPSDQGWIPVDPNFNRYQLQLSSGSPEIDDEVEEMESPWQEKCPLTLEKAMESLEEPTEFNLPVIESYALHEKTVASVGELQQKSEMIGISEESSIPISTCNENKHASPYTCDDSEKPNKDSSNAMSCMDQCVYDIHVIDDKLNIGDEVRGNGSEMLLENVSLDMPRSCDSPVISRSQTEQYIGGNFSDKTRGLPPSGLLNRKPSLSDLRRNSMSAVDYERFKIDNEVGWLKERLKIIQEDREKLSVSMEHMEKDNVQLQTLENTMSQLQEIRQLAEPGNAVHRVSLPPPSCQISSKKRCWRSVSLESRRSVD